MFRPRYIAPVSKPAPKPISGLSRAQVAGRITVLRAALDLLWGQSDLDGGEPIPCIGKMKVALIELEGQLHAIDRQRALPTIADGIRAVVAGRPLPTVPFAAAVSIPAAEQRLRQAGADLAELARELVVDAARAMANRAAINKAFTDAGTRGLEATVRIRELAELNRLPMEEIAELAPTLARELQAPHRGE
jgi:hypothetical protein